MIVDRPYKEHETLREIRFSRALTWYRQKGSYYFYLLKKDLPSLLGVYKHRYQVFP